MNILNSIKGFVHGFKCSVKTELDIIEMRKNASVFGFPSVHVANTVDQGYPVFLADDFVFVNTKIRGLPQAYAVSLANGVNEIYVNREFAQLPEKVCEAVIGHEVGHLVLAQVYTTKERTLANLGLSNKPYLCECAADDYSVASGYDMLGALIYLRDKCGYFGKELDKRIARLSK